MFDPKGEAPRVFVRNTSAMNVSVMWKSPFRTPACMTPIRSLEYEYLRCSTLVQSLGSLHRIEASIGFFYLKDQFGLGLVFLLIPWGEHCTRHIDMDVDGIEQQFLAQCLGKAYADTMSAWVLDARLAKDPPRMACFPGEYVEYPIMPK